MTDGLARPRTAAIPLHSGRINHPVPTRSVTFRSVRPRQRDTVGDFLESGACFGPSETAAWCGREVK